MLFLSEIERERQRDRETERKRDRETDREKERGGFQCPFNIFVVVLFFVYLTIHLKKKRFVYYM